MSTRRKIALLVVGLAVVIPCACATWLVAGDSDVTEVKSLDLFKAPGRYDGQRISVLAYFDANTCSLLNPLDSEHPIIVNLPRCQRALAWIAPVASGLVRVHGTLLVERPPCEPCPPDAFNTLPRASEPVTTVDAYRAMLRVLEYYFHVDSEFPVGGILSEMASGVWADNLPGDPATWPRWLKAIDDTKRHDSTAA